MYIYTQCDPSLLYFSELLILNLYFPPSYKNPKHIVSNKVIFPVAQNIKTLKSHSLNDYV